jgi:hypothetical protein
VAYRNVRAKARTYLSRNGNGNSNDSSNDSSNGARRSPSGMTTKKPTTSLELPLKLSI